MHCGMFWMGKRCLVLDMIAHCGTHSFVLLAAQDEVLVAGFGRRGHAVGDIPGVRFKVSGVEEHQHGSQRCSCTMQYMSGRNRLLNDGSWDAGMYSKSYALQLWLALTGTDAC